MMLRPRECTPRNNIFPRTCTKGVFIEHACPMYRTHRRDIVSILLERFVCAIYHVKMCIFQEIKKTKGPLFRQKNIQSSFKHDLVHVFWTISYIYRRLCHKMSTFVCIHSCFLFRLFFLVFFMGVLTWRWWTHTIKKNSRWRATPSILPNTLRFVKIQHNGCIIDTCFHCLTYISLLLKVFKVLANPWLCLCWNLHSLVYVIVC